MSHKDVKDHDALLIKLNNKSKIYTFRIHIYKTNYIHWEAREGFHVVILSGWGSLRNWLETDLIGRYALVKV